MSDIKYKSKLVDTRLKDDYGNVIHNIRGHQFLHNEFGWRNKVYKNPNLPTAPDYTPETYDYDFAKDAVAVKNLVLFNEYKEATTDAGHTDFPTMDYVQLRSYILPIQEHLVKIGYLEQEDVDGIMGPKTEGAIKRYDYNKPSTVEEMWHGIKSIF